MSHASDVGDRLVDNPAAGLVTTGEEQFSSFPLKGTEGGSRLKQKTRQLLAHTGGYRIVKANKNYSLRFEGIDLRKQL
jgi:hypothetical protein